ncbi:MAG: hypothetical protein NVSMB52_16140 [Chloroflexota bacterium]
MAGRVEKQHDIERLKRKVAKADLRLQAAQEDASQARERGKQEIDGARLRAAEWMARAAARVEKRARKLTRAEERLRECVAWSDGLNGNPRKAQAGSEPSPEDTVDILQQREATVEFAATPSLVTASDGSRVTPSTSASSTGTE